MTRVLVEILTVDEILSDAYSADHFRENGHKLVDMLADQLRMSLDGEQQQSIPWIDPSDCLEHFARILADGTTFETFAEEVLSKSVRISDPRFMGHQICAPVPTTILAGFLTDYLNNGSGVYEMGMAGTAMEKAVVQTVARRFGMPATSDGFMTSGGTLANLTAMLAARSVKSGHQDWTNGTHNQLAILVSEQAHYCVDRAVRIMGWGEAGIIRVPVDDRFKMRVELLPDLLAQAIEENKKVVAIVGSACTTSTGSFDNLEAIAEFAKTHDLWFHVDGAHGAAVAFSSKHRHLLRGIENADSVTLDFHKMLMTPVLSSALIFGDKLNSYRPFSLEADYLFDQQEESLDEYNLAKRTFECTKTMLSAKVFSLLAVHGVEILEANVDQLHENTQLFYRILREHSEFEVATVPETNIVCFRKTNKLIPDTSALNAQLRDILTREGIHYIVKTTLNGEVWLRCTIANPFTSEVHMRELLIAIGRAEQSILDAC